MAIKSYCATHWGAREPQHIEPETTLPDDATCVVCGAVACRAEGAADFIDQGTARDLAVENVVQTTRSKRP